MRKKAPRPGASRTDCFTSLTDESARAEYAPWAVQEFQVLSFSLTALRRCRPVASELEISNLAAKRSANLHGLSIEYDLTTQYTVLYFVILQDGPEVCAQRLWQDIHRSRRRLPLPSRTANFSRRAERCLGAHTESIMLHQLTPSYRLEMLQTPLSDLRRIPRYPTMYDRQTLNRR